MELTAESVLTAYTRGAFPMTDPDGVTRWYTADPRGVFPLERFHVPKSLRQTLRGGRFEVRVDTAFADVMRACKDVPRRRPAGSDFGGIESGSWISEALIDVYAELFGLGFAHSVECWADGRLVGGLYGVHLGAAFFGESMFHRTRDASKVALVHLVARLTAGGFELLDTQACTPHLARFGCVEVPAREYLRRLARATQRPCEF